MVLAPNFFAISFLKLFDFKLFFWEAFNFDLKWRPHGVEGEGLGCKLKSSIQILDPNRGRKSWTQIADPNRGPKSWTQIGDLQNVDPNRGPKSWTQILTAWTQIVDPNFYEGNLFIFSVLDPNFWQIFDALRTFSGTLFGTIWGDHLGNIWVHAGKIWVHGPKFGSTIGIDNVSV